MASGGRRDLSKELFWRRLVRGQATSGLSVRAWCRRHGQRESAFYWWRRELARRDAEQTTLDAPPALGGSLREGPRSGRGVSRATFVPVQVNGDEAAGGDGWMEIVLGGQRRIRLSGHVDRQVLTDVLAVMEKRTC